MEVDGGSRGFDLIAKIVGGEIRSVGRVNSRKPHEKPDNA